MHTCLHYPTNTLRRNRQNWWCLPWCIAMVLALVLGTPPPAHAKTLHCGAGDVQCLIDAIQEANANGQANTILLAAGTYFLTAVDNITKGPNGLPAITNTLTLWGAGAESTRLERVFTTPDPCPTFDPLVDPAFRILYVAPTGVLTLKGLTLRGGCVVDDEPGVDAADVTGGGLFTEGKVSLLHSAIVENGVEDILEQGAPGGGGITNKGSLVVSQSTILRNSAGFVSLGGAGILNSGTLMVTDSTIADNAECCSGTGGGIWSDGTLTVFRSHIIHNGADVIGGINTRGFAVIAQSSIVRNGANFPNRAAGNISNSGTLYLTASIITENFAGSSLTNFGTLTIHNSTIAENENFAGVGGIVNEGGTLTILNSTIARNISAGFPPLGAGAGIWNAPSDGTRPLGTVTVQNTILAQNTFEEPRSGISGGPDCSGPITSLGTNLIGDPTGCTITLQASDLTGDPGLGDFTDNGRPGNGHVPLLPTSQAIDAGNDAVCPRRDQLGQRRVDIPDVGTSRCDIGAIEFQHRDKHQDNADNDQPDADPAITAQAAP